MLLFDVKNFSLRIGKDLVKESCANCVFRINVTLTSGGDKNVRNFTDNSLTVSKPMLSKECYKDFYSMLKYCRHGYFHQIQGKKNTHTPFFLIYIFPIYVFIIYKLSFCENIQFTLEVSLIDKIKTTNNNYLIKHSFCHNLGVISPKIYA